MLAILPEFSFSGMESIVLGAVALWLVLFKIELLLFVVELLLLVFSKVTAAAFSVPKMMDNENIKPKTNKIPLMVFSSPIFGHIIGISD